MRLQKYMARSGVASRRGSEDLIRAGRVSVNGIVITEMGFQVDETADVVAVDGAVVSLVEDNVVLLFNKPLDCVTTMTDPQGRRCVSDIVPVDRYPGLFPIGRLDRNTTGLLLFSTDGQLGHGLLHPKFHVEKRYIAQVPAGVTKKVLARLANGVELGDGWTAPAKASLVGWGELCLTPAMCSLDPKLKDTQLIDLRIKEGRKRQVRRMCKAVGFPVINLHRFAFDQITLGSMAMGEHRLLDGEEVARLKAIAGMD